MFSTRITWLDLVAGLIQGRRRSSPAAKLKNRTRRNLRKSQRPNVTYSLSWRFMPRHGEKGTTTKPIVPVGPKGVQLDDR